jgi:hypothetical protein
MNTTYFRSLRFALLIFSLYCHFADSAYTHTIFPIVLWQEFFDLPYFYLKYNMQTSKLINITLHHAFVIIMYSLLMSTPFINVHMLMYMLHHLVANLPLYIPYRKYILCISWSGQVIVPLVSYHRDLKTVVGNHTTVLCLWIMISCCAYAYLGLAAMWMKWRKQLCIYYSIQTKEGNFMQNIF